MTADYLYTVHIRGVHPVKGIRLFGKLLNIFIYLFIHPHAIEYITRDSCRNIVTYLLLHQLILTPEQIIHPI